MGEGQKNLEIKKVEIFLIKFISFLLVTSYALHFTFLIMFTMKTIEVVVISILLFRIILIIFVIPIIRYAFLIS